MSFFSDLFRSDKIIDNASKGIDAVWLTGEEKTQYFLEYLKASMPMNLSRRFIAIIVTFMWALVGLVELVTIFLIPDKTAEVHSFATIYVMPSFTVLVSFYFWRRLKKGDP